ncbi:hypothetical protein WBO78_02530 [Bosea sp. CCNWLW174]|jgi:hypothetical protein|uniref:hypothetical protein n=1 Tax=unclassified Bosea (in: a-proteobacteria) TaxID=2653178 RepID=UPI003015519B
MTEVTNELIYEVLKRIQGDTAALREGQTEIRTELAAMRGHMLAIQTDVANIYGKLASHDVRLDRIDNRLNLISEPAQ